MNHPKHKNNPEKFSYFGRLVLLIMSASILNPYEIEQAQKSRGALLAPVSKEYTLLMRNVGYSGAATSLLLILSILQIGAPSITLKISVTAATLALPLWLVSGLIYEAYLSLDISIFPHQRSPLAKFILPAIQITAGVGLLLSLTGLVHHIWPMAAWTLLTSIILSVLLLIFFYLSIICYWLAQMLKELFNIDLFQRMRVKSTVQLKPNDKAEP